MLTTAAHYTHTSHVDLQVPTPGTERRRQLTHRTAGSFRTPSRPRRCCVTLTIKPQPHRGPRASLHAGGTNAPANYKWTTQVRKEESPVLRSAAGRSVVFWILFCRGPPTHTLQTTQDAQGNPSSKQSGKPQLHTRRAPLRQHHTRPWTSEVYFRNALKAGRLAFISKQSMPKYCESQRLNFTEGPSALPSKWGLRCLPPGPSGPLQGSKGKDPNTVWALSLWDMSRHYCRTGSWGTFQCDVTAEVKEQELPHLFTRAQSRSQSRTC